MDTHRHRRVLVVGEHLLPVGLLRQLGDLRRRLERQRKLTVPAGDRLATRGDAEAPEQLAARPPLVTGAGCDERLERVAVHRRPARKVAEIGVRLPGLDRLRIGFAHRLHVAETDPYRTVLDRALRQRAVDVRRPHLDPTPLCVTDERRRRIETHRLRVQQRAEKLTRVVAPQPRRLVGEQRERRSV